MLVALNKRSHLILWVALLTGMLMLVSGCGGERSNQAPRETINIAGSTSVQPFSEILAQKFMEKNPGIKINVQGGGSAQGIAAASSGTAQIGSSSAELKAQQKTGLVETRLALDGIAILVNPANPISELKKDEVMNIFLGNIRNWKELGGIDAAITVVSREEGSGTRSAFEDLVLAKQRIIRSALIQNSTGGIKVTVAGDKNAIAYDSLGAVDQSVKALRIDGYDPGPTNVKNGSYKIARPFIYLTRGEPRGAVKEYLDFVVSEEGQKILQENGVIPVR